MFMNNRYEAGFSDHEKAAMRQRAEELKSLTGVKGAAKRAREFQACLDAIADLSGNDKEIAERFHIIVTEEAEELAPKTWYGFPSYAYEDQVIMFLQPSSKFDTRYCTIGFNDHASLDNGDMWPTAFAVRNMTAEVEKQLRTIVRQATRFTG